MNNQKLGTKLVKYEHNSRSSDDDIIEKMNVVSFYVFLRFEAVL